LHAGFQCTGLIFTGWYVTKTI